MIDSYILIWDKNIRYPYLVCKKNLSLLITVCHHSTSLVMPIGDPQNGFFYPTLTLMTDSYILTRDKNIRYPYPVCKKNPSLGITVCHQSASLVMPKGNPLDRFFFPTLTLMIDSYVLTPDKKPDILIRCVRIICPSGSPFVITRHAS